MDKPRFIYVTYIATTPEKLWNALIDPETTTKYWTHVNVSDWQPGSTWEHRDSGVCRNHGARMPGGQQTSRRQEGSIPLP